MAGTTSHTSYQVFILGYQSKFIKEIRSMFGEKLKELGVKKNLVKFVTERTPRRNVENNAPSVCLYFGKLNYTGNIEAVDSVLKRGIPTLPIYFSDFNRSIPPSLRGINAIQVRKSIDCERIVSTMLDALGLVRKSRRLFISYKRTDSSNTAIQLFNKLEHCGFDVFLDSHSIAPMNNFQDELWHRLADTDVVVLLNTKNYLDSQWTREELAKADSMTIGIYQLIWPDQKTEQSARISVPLKLHRKDFYRHRIGPNSVLNETTLQTIASSVERLRARSFAARQTNLVKEFIDAAAKIHVKVTRFDTRCLILKRVDKKEIIILPTIGVPEAFTYFESEALARKLKSTKVAGIRLLYDHSNLRDNWLKHLDWLDDQLRVKSIRTQDISTAIRRLARDTDVIKKNFSFS